VGVSEPLEFRILGPFEVARDGGLLELPAGKPIDFGAVATHLKGEAELTLLSELTLRDDVDDQTLQRIDENLRPLEKSYLERRTTEIQREIVEAVRVGDDGRLSELLAEKGRISSSLK